MNGRSIEWETYRVLTILVLEYGRVQLYIEVAL